MALSALVLASAGLTTAFAQTPPTTTTTPPPNGAPQWHHDHQSVLTDAEKAQLKRAHDEVLATNPDLQTEETNLTTQREKLKSEGDSATIGDQKALREAFHAHMQKMHAAMLAFDPTLAPIFAKLQAAHQGGHHFAKN